ncbi:MAG: 50S ribosomal protein L11 methyltransferase [Lachnospiraceae bacterium]|nr:50S ribosomal protein L11 methyltransferase [Lachnospiraceae bacterium]
MKYTKYTIKTTTKDADMVCALLMDYDIVDVQIENNVQLTDEELNQLYAAMVKDLPEDDGSCSISFFIDYDEEKVEETDQLIEDVKAGLAEAPDIYGIDPVELMTEEQDSADWENNWKEFFKPFRVDDILIAPTWESVPENMEGLENKGGAGEEEETEPKLTIRIDPGMAFGTGTHETTRLCLRGLRKYMKEGDKVLDLGCGSGILGIGSIKLGASTITSVDIDEQAVKVAKENFEINDVCPEVSTFFLGDVVENEELKNQVIALHDTEEGYGPYDIVVVNILADVIKLMLPTLDQYLKKGGYLILSGILDVKEQLIRDGIEANKNLKLTEVFQDGEWVRVTAERV